MMQYRLAASIAWVVRTGGGDAGTADDCLPLTFFALLQALLHRPLEIEDHLQLNFSAAALKDDVIELDLFKCPTVDLFAFSQPYHLTIPTAA